MKRIPIVIQDCDTPVTSAASIDVNVVSFSSDPSDVLRVLSLCRRTPVLWQGGESLGRLNDAPLLMVMDGSGARNDPRAGLTPADHGSLADRRAETLAVLPNPSITVESMLIRLGFEEILAREDLNPSAMERALARARLRRDVSLGTTRGLAARSGGSDPSVKAAAGLLDRLRIAVLIVRADATILHVNARAANLLRDRRALMRTPRGQVAALVSRRESSVLHALIHDVATGRADTDMALPITASDGGAPVSVMVVPIGRRAAGAALFVSDPGEELLVDEGCLMALYGLTPSEAMVLSQLAQGRSVEDIAVNRNHKTATVRQHLKAVYRKLAVRRQCEAIKVVLSGPAILGKNNL